jgi:hypothetical protein
VGLTLRDQAQRLFRWDRGWLRVEGVDALPEKTRVEMTVFVADGTSDVFYVDPDGTLLVAGPWTATALRSTFPDFRTDSQYIHHLGPYYYPRDIQRDARQRVQPGQEIRYVLEFPAIAVVPDVLDVKVRFVHLQDTGSMLHLADGHVSGGNIMLASCRWDAALRREIDTLAAKVKGKPPASKDAGPETPAGTAPDAAEEIRAGVAPHPRV